MNKRIFSYLVFTLVLFLTTAQAQLVEPASFKTHIKRISPSVIEISFAGKIEANWHIYSTNITVAGPTRTSFNMDKATGVRTMGALKAIGNEIENMDLIFQQRIKYFENKVTFVQRLELTEKDYTAKGYLEYAACNDKSCIPPSQVEFQIQGSDGPTPSAVTEASAKQANVQVAAKSPTSTKTSTLSQAARDSISVKLHHEEWWKPSIKELEQFSSKPNTGLWSVFLLGLLSGLIALLTPCVWPIIPMTVGFFIHRSRKRRRAIYEASLYSFSIVAIYLFIGLAVTLWFGANALNAMSTNMFFNIFFFALLVVFGTSLLGAFDLSLPASWNNSINRKADKSSGIFGIFLMAFTLALVSFSCTGPIIGLLLVELTTSASILSPTVGMLGFAIALALPFGFFAMFPSLLKKLPKSGGWLNTVKVSLGFFELAFALKFFSIADLAYNWHILDRETFLAIWITLFALLGLYLLGKLRFPGEAATSTISIPRFFMSIASLAFAIYMIPGLWGAPLKAISAFVPPLNTQDFNLYSHNVEPAFTDYDAGMAYAETHHKPVLLDFTGKGCVNCRKMESSVWQDNSVRELLTKNFVLISLSVDDKTPLDTPISINEHGREYTLKTVGGKWSYLQRHKFGSNTQPYYVPVNNAGQPLNSAYSYDEDAQRFLEFLQKAEQRF